MKSIVNRKFYLLKFSALYGITVLLLVVLFAAFSSGTPPSIVNTTKVSASTKPVVIDSEILKTDRFFTQQVAPCFYADEQHALQLSNPQAKALLKERHADIARMEYAFKITLDSIDRQADKMNSEKSTKETKDLVSHFRSILNNRQVNAMAQSAPVSKNFSADAELQQTVLKLETTLAQKNQQIAVLEKKETGISPILYQNLKSELEVRNKRLADLQKREPVVNQAAIQNLKKELDMRDKKIAQLENQISAAQKEDLVLRPATGENTSDLRQRNANLKQAYNATQTQLGVVAKELNILKREHERLQNQLAEQRKTGGN